MREEAYQVVDCELLDGDLWVAEGGKKKLGGEALENLRGDDVAWVSLHKSKTCCYYVTKTCCYYASYKLLKESDRQCKTKDTAAAKCYYTDVACSNSDHALCEKKDNATQTQETCKMCAKSCVQRCKRARGRDYRRFAEYYYSSAVTSNSDKLSRRVCNV